MSWLKSLLVMCAFDKLFKVVAAINGIVEG
jgi:hypothetical protein